MPRAKLSPRRWRLLRILLGLQVTALAAMFLSGHWDAAEHAKGTVDSFWYPPHYGIYFGILVASLLSGAGLLLLVWGSPVSPFQALKQNTALTLVVVANVLGFTGAPADALWHQIFGIDLTVWSPPHLHLLLGEVLAALACVVYFLAPPRRGDQLLQPLRGQHMGRTLAIVGVLVLALLMSSFLFFEYEAGSRSQLVLARPRWVFPLLWAWYVCFVLGTVTATNRRIGMAIAVALTYDIARLATLAFDRTVLGYESALGYPLLLAALPWDAVLFVVMRRRQTPQGRPWLIAGAIAAAVVAVSTPAFFAAFGIAPELTVTPWLQFGVPAVAAGVLGAGMGWWAGSTLRRLRPHDEAVVSGIGREAGSSFGREPVWPKG